MQSCKRAHIGSRDLSGNMLASEASSWIECIKRAADGVHLDMTHRALWIGETAAIVGELALNIVGWCRQAATQKTLSHELAAVYPRVLGWVGVTHQDRPLGKHPRPVTKKGRCARYHFGQPPPQSISWTSTPPNDLMKSEPKAIEGV